MLDRAFFHDGTYSSFRGRNHGRPVDTRSSPAAGSSVYLQNHDQIGNRATGDRLTAAPLPRPARLGAALVLTSPFTPMLFMGEEWGARTPWQFFTSTRSRSSREAVAEGRTAEFAEHGWDAARRARPAGPGHLPRSKLDWTEREQEPQAREPAHCTAS